MKTFKLVAYKMKNKKGEIISIPLEDGLIINKENENRLWNIELFIKKEWLKVFEEYRDSEEFPVSVIITRPDNNPAYFTTKIISRKEMDDYASVLLEGKINRRVNFYAEEVLEELVKVGLTGQELLDAFNERLYQKKTEK